MILRFFLPAFLLLFFCSCGNKDNGNDAKVKTTLPKPKPKAEQKPGLVYPYEVTKPKKNSYEDARVRIGDSIVFCSYKGKIDVSDTLGNSRVNITHLQCEYLMERVFVLPLQDRKWFIIWQETDQKGQHTSLAVFTEGEKNPDWELTFPYTNAGPPVLDGNMCYFTTMGMAAKVNVENGEMQWKVDSLFNSFKWNYKRFYVPLVYENKVVFVDLPERGRRDKRDTLVVDPVSGKRKK